MWPNPFNQLARKWKGSPLGFHFCLCIFEWHLFSQRSQRHVCQRNLFICSIDWLFEYSLRGNVVSKMFTYIDVFTKTKFYQATTIMNRLLLCKAYPLHHFTFFRFVTTVMYRCYHTGYIQINLILSI